MKKLLRVLVAMLVLSLAIGLVPAMADEDEVLAEGVVISQNVSLRKEKSTGAARIRYLKNGEMFNILKDEDSWYYVSYHDADKKQDLVGWVRKDFVLANPEFITLRNPADIYAYPSGSNKKVGQLGKYERLTVIDQTNSYWVVSVRNASGFISKNVKVWMDEDLAPWLEKKADEGKVTTKTTIRTGPAKSWDSIKTLAVGDKVSVLGQDGDWYVISYEKAIAYIPVADVELNAPLS